MTTYRSIPITEEYKIEFDSVAQIVIGQLDDIGFPSVHVSNPDIALAK